MSASSKRSLFVGVLSVALACVFSGGAFADFAYPGFAGAGNLHFNGQAQIVGDQLQLVLARGHRVGSAYYADKVLVAYGFDTTFTFRIGGGTGADGFAFVVQDAPAGLNALGADGGALGYGLREKWESPGGGVLPGIPRSLAVEFDAHRNFMWFTEQNGNHVAALSRGAEQNTPDHSQSLLDQSIYTPAFDLNNNVPHVARIRYVPGSLEIYLGEHTLPSSPLITYGVDLTDIGGANILDNQGMAYVGFTASTGDLTTGDLTDIHSITSWSFASVPVPEPSTLGLLIAAAVATLVWSWRRKSQVVCG